MRIERRRRKNLLFSISFYRKVNFQSHYATLFFISSSKGFRREKIAIINFISVKLFIFEKQRNIIMNKYLLFLYNEFSFDPQAFVIVFFSSLNLRQFVSLLVKTIYYIDFSNAHI